MSWLEFALPDASGGLGAAQADFGNSPNIVLP
jgi:hypothetical protein